MTASPCDVAPAEPTIDFLRDRGREESRVDEATAIDLLRHSLANSGGKGLVGDLTGDLEAVMLPAPGSSSPSPFLLRLAIMSVSI